MIAHRGLRGIEPENSTAAFIAAGNRSYYGIESDVHATKDGFYVMIHDQRSGRVATKNLKIRATLLAALREISLFNRDGSLSDLKVPKLEDYIKICHRYEKVAFLELKDRFSEKQLREILKIIKRLKHLEQTVFISFHLSNLLTVKKINPAQKLQYLMKKPHAPQILMLLRYKIGLDLEYSRVTPELIERFHQAKLEVNCYTCNDPLEAERLAAMGIDYITTDLLE